MPGNEFLVPMEMSFIMNPLNMVEFSDKEYPFVVKNYDETLKVICGLAPKCKEDLEESSFQ